MKNCFRITLALALLPLMASPSRASANLVQHPLISEVQTGTTASATQEFVELYNPADAPVSLAGWIIEYKAATSAISESSWSKKASLIGSIPAHGFYLIAQRSYINSSDAEWSPTLAASAGTLRLRDETGSVMDQLGYGETANAARGLPVSAPAAGSSIERLPGRLEPLSGNGTDSSNNQADFILRTPAEPQTAASRAELPGDAPVEEVDEDSAAPITPPSYAAIAITEALVDPLAPLSDAEDEFIELYNPTSEAVDLKDYTLRCGSNFRDYYELPSIVIPAAGYVVLYARETKLGLTNSGGAIQLLDPSGTIVDQTPDYIDTPPGQSWAAFDDGWQWTLQLTPGQPNILAALPAVSATTAISKVKAVTKKAAAKAAPKPKKAAAAKVAKPKKPKKAKAAAAFTTVPVAVSKSLQPSTWLIISLAILTIGYALYEFRYDLYHLYYRLRRNRPARPSNRPPVEGRGRD